MLVASVALAAAGYSLSSCRQLGALGGLVDEYFLLGVNLNVHGTLGIGDQPVVNRPPGYPVFVAIVMRLLSGQPAGISPVIVERAAHGVYLAQGLSHAATAALLFLWLATRLRTTSALCAGLLFALNPFSVVLVGIGHYDVLHMFLLVAGIALLSWSLGEPTPRRLALAGAFWGVAALVRPLTLPLPAFVLCLLLLRTRSARSSAGGAAIFGLAMLLPILPWTLRNHAVSGRFVLVHVQGWTALWGSTVQDRRMDPNHYQWYDLAPTALRPIYTRVTGASEYDIETHRRFTFELEHALEQAALQNLADRPAVYLRNVARGFASLCTQMNSVLLRAFEYAQRGGSVTQAFFFTGNAQDAGPATLAESFSGWIAASTLLAAFGVLSGLRHRDPALLAPLAVFLCVAGMHALVYVDLMYYYVRLPFVFAFAAFGLDALHGRRLALPGGRGVPFAALPAAALLCWGLWLTGSLLASCGSG